MSIISKAYAEGAAGSTGWWHGNDHHAGRVRSHLLLRMIYRPQAKRAKSIAI